MTEPPDPDAPTTSGSPRDDSEVRPEDAEAGFAGPEVATPAAAASDREPDAASRIIRPPARDASLPAMAATVALVLFSVFIGVYGPRLGNRQQLPGGTTLIELAGAVEPRHAQRVFQARALADAPSFSIDEVETRIAEAIGRRFRAPVPSGYTLRWLAVDEVRLPGAAGALAFCTAESLASVGGRDAFASVLVLRDEDRFTVFDRHGRPVALPEGEVFSVEMRTVADGATLAVFRAGELVFAVQTADPALSAELVAALEVEAAAALRPPEA